MSEPEQPRGFFQRALVRGVALGCAIQLAMSALSVVVVLFVMRWNIYSSDAKVVQAAWVIKGGALASAAILIGVALRLRQLHKLDKARGVALSIPLAFALGLALAAGIFVLLLAMC